MITPTFSGHAFEAECKECNSIFSNANKAERHARETNHEVEAEVEYRVTWKK